MNQDWNINKKCFFRFGSHKKCKKMLSNEMTTLLQRIKRIMSSKVADLLQSPSIPADGNLDFWTCLRRSAPPPVQTGDAHSACHEHCLFLFFKCQCQHVDSVCLLVYKDKQERMQLSMLQAPPAEQTKRFCQQRLDTGDIRDQQRNLSSYFSNKTLP